MTTNKLKNLITKYMQSSITKYYKIKHFYLIFMKINNFDQIICFKKKQINVVMQYILNIIILQLQ